MRVVCIGGAHIDAKALVDGEVRSGTSNPAQVSRTPGGVACNVARNLTRLGVDVSLVSRVGDDAPGHGLLASLDDEGIDVTAVEVVPGAPTASYLAVIDGSGALAVGIADMAIYDSMDASWAQDVASEIAGYDIWVIETNLPAEAISVLAATHGDHLLMADPVSVEKSLRLQPSLHRFDLAFPDLAEAAALAHRPGEDDPAALAGAIPCRTVITLGPDGVAVDGERFPAIEPDRLADVTGAGDAGVAGWIYGLAVGSDATPVDWALAASSLTVETDDSVRADLSVSMLEDRVARGR